MFHLHKKDMVGFDLEDVIFITNKWDKMSFLGYSSDEDENEDEKVSKWNCLKFDIKSIWPCVKEKNIFRTSLVYVITQLLGYL